MSSYMNFDHAGWMESHNKALVRRHPKLAAKVPTELNEFQRKVVHIIGVVGGGIYNAPINRDKIDWKYGWNGISVVWQHELATWDYSELTTLVLMCHAARIRCSVNGCGPRNLRVSFWARTHEGDIAVRHPNIEEAVKIFDEVCGPDHFIRYRASDFPGGAK